MVEHHQIPSELKSLLGEENVQFFVKADKERTTKELWSVIRGGLFWIIIIGGIFTAMVYELLLGKPTSLYIGNTYTTISPDDLSPLFGFFIFGFFFVLPGFILIALGIFGFFRKGGYFLGTQSRLLQLNSWNECSVHDWSGFQNKIDLFFTNTKGNLMFTLKETEIIKRGGEKRQKHKIMRMAEIRYAKEIKEFCHEKIANAAVKN